MKHKKGFTLVELLTVVMIVGILTAVALPQYRKAIQKSRATEAVAMLRVIYDSSERLAAEMGKRSMTNLDSSVLKFSRLDMFDADEIKCGLSGTVMTCDEWTYTVSPSYIDAVSLKQNMKGANFRLYPPHTDNNSTGVVRIVCRSYNDEGEACDLYGYDWENSWVGKSYTFPENGPWED